MKKLLSMLLALFMSMSNNVDYQAQGDVPYAAGSYYTIEEGQAPDYRSIYGSQVVASREIACKPIPWKGACKSVNYTDGAQHVNAYWLASSDSKNYADLSDDYTYTFDKECQIIIPYTGTLLSASGTSDGTSMVVKCEVNDDSYQLHITGMDRWWCCMGRNETQKVTNSYGELVWEHTCRELQGTSFNQGQVLGRSIAGETKVKIFKYVDGKATVACTLKDFYNH